jgi:hypothetical protein
MSACVRSSTHGRNVSVFLFLIATLAAIVAMSSVGTSVASASCVRADWFVNAYNQGYGPTVKPNDSCQDLNISAPAAESFESFWYHHYSGGIIPCRGGNVNCILWHNFTPGDNFTIYTRGSNHQTTHPLY